MAEFIKSPLPDDATVICTSDWHVGSKTFHEAAAIEIADRLLDEEDTYLMFVGDALEGKKIDSPHFNPEGLRTGQLNIHDQADHFIDILKDPADQGKIALMMPGNHDIYLSRDFDIFRYITKELGVPRGGYQTWVDTGKFIVHAYHGRTNLPRGAKDPIQREANQRAWLVNKLSPLAGDALVHLTGHTHALLIQEPLQEYALLSGGENVNGRYFTQPTQDVVTYDPISGNEDHRQFIPPTSRWYANTGTLRRSGGFGFEDYAEIGGYAPAPIGYVEMTLSEGLPVAMDKVVV